MAGRHVLGVLSDGTIYPCSRLSLKVGNVLEEDMEQILRSDIMKKFDDRKNNLKGKCKSCKFVNSPLFSDICEAGASCLAFASTGDPFMPDPNCTYNPLDEINDEQ